MMTTLGQHWILDAFECDLETLQDTRIFLDTLNELPIALKMTPVCEPQVYSEKNITAGLLLIAESHISLHAHHDSRQLHVDIFSCAAFDSDLAREVLTRRFRFSRFTERTIDR